MMNNESTTISGARGVLIADEMGLGKTIQAIGVINACADMQRVLIVCPASLKNAVWSKELRKWLTRPMAIEVVNGKGAVLSGNGICIINYDILKKHEAALMAKEWDLVVLDEAHYTKNESAQRTKIAHAIPAKRRLYLTGTPILNRPVELFPLLSALDPERWNKKSFFKFALRYCNAHQISAGKRMVWDFGGASNLDELQKMLRSSVMVRRLKKDVLKELPPKRRAIVELDADENIKAIAAREMAKWQEQRALIASLRESAELAALMDDKAAYETAVLALRNAATAAFSEMAAVRHECAVAKAPIAAQFIIEQLEGSDEKIVVFAHHRDVVEIMMRELAAYNPVMLIGGMSDKAKNASVEKFMGDAGCRVFVGNIQAAGVGITLTESSHVIFCELDWVPANVTQAEDRCHRIGQTDSVLVQHLVIEDSLDAKMAKTIIEKQRIADAALDNRPTFGSVGETKSSQVTVFEPNAQPDGTATVKGAGTYSDAQIAAAHKAMQMLAGVCDYAARLDGQGFNKYDAPFGHSLAQALFLTQKQAHVAVRLANKYRGQLPAELVKAAKGE